MVLLTFAEFPAGATDGVTDGAEVGLYHNGDFADIDVGNVALELLDLDWRDIAEAPFNGGDVVIVAGYGGVNFTTDEGVCGVREVSHTGDIREHSALKSVPLGHNRFLQGEFPEGEFHADFLPGTTAFFNDFHTNG